MTNNFSTQYSTVLQKTSAELGLKLQDLGSGLWSS